MRSKRAVVLAALMAGVLLLTACSSGGEDPPSIDELASTPTPTPTPDPVCPLTGEPPGAGVDLDRPAVAIKVENSPESRPQSGIESADIVYEERVEGGITRFMLIFHCNSTDVAGSVRSGRFDDPKLALPFTSMVIASGSNQIVTDEMEAKGIHYLVEGSTEGLYRDTTLGSGVHSLFANPEVLLKEAKKAKVEPPVPGVLNFGELPASAKKAAAVQMHFTDTNTIEYRWEGGGWARYEAGVPFMARSGEQISVPNVLVQLVRIDNSSTIVDVAGNPSPMITFVGSGNVLLFRDGKVIKGTWTIKKEGDAPVYKDKKGDLLLFDTGSTWIELIPTDEGDVKGSVSFQKKAAQAG